MGKFRRGCGFYKWALKEEGVKRDKGQCEEIPI